MNVPLFLHCVLSYARFTTSVYHSIEIQSKFTKAMESGCREGLIPWHVCDTKVSTKRACLFSYSHIGICGQINSIEGLLKS